MDKYEKFKNDIYKLINLNLSDYKEKQMKRRINSLINKNNYKDFDDYFIGLKSNKDLFDEFINYVTINVSEFFRNPIQWNTLENIVIPMLYKSNKKLKIWSSACSTGEEPYSLAMLLNETIGSNNYELTASDIDETAIKKAKDGLYNIKSINDIPAKYKKYFKEKDGKHLIDKSLKNNITFKKINLLEDSFSKNYDLILCRNVMIYFTEEAKSKLYFKFNDSLKDDGVLFVGSTEQIILPNKYNFNLVETFFYKKMIK